jgi:septum formation protein
MIGNGHQQLILASASKARSKLLAGAGLSFGIEPSRVDEAAIRQALLGKDGEIAPEDLAEVLARAKAQDVSERNPGAVVIGGDQVLAIGDRVFEKSASADDARSQLLELRGRTHMLCSAVVIAEDGEVTWSHVDTAHVTFRNFTPAFVGQYMAMAGPAVFESVGCYQLEGPGVQLIETLSGCAFTVLGMPLLALLAELRQRGIIAT